MLERFSLSWDQHNKNVCNGLSTLQQNGELVDMTLAADGHMVKVHQIVMSLISPYIKELIVSANCPHPVVFLNKISYKTLSHILEFIYRGEVLVENENLLDLIQAGKELHIKGLQELQKFDTEDCTTPKSRHKSENDEQKTLNDTFNTSIKNESLNEIADDVGDVFEDVEHLEMDYYDNSQSEYNVDDNQDDVFEADNNEHKIQIIEKLSSNCTTQCKNKIMPKAVLSANIKVAGTDKDYSIDPSMLQYTVSNQGSLQVILNKYIYYLRYASKTKSKHVVWRCVEYVKHRCPAYLVSRGNNVLRRVAMHTHANHERRIKKKMVAGAIFDRVNRAEEYGAAIKEESKTMSQ